MDSWLSLARALLAASRARSTGVLAVATEHGVARVALDAGVPRAASALIDEADALGDVLLRSGALDPRGHHERLAERRPSGSVGQWLVDAQLATRGQVERALRAQLRGRLLRILACTRHELSFAQGAPDVGAPLVAEPTSSEDLVLLALRSRVASWPAERVEQAMPRGVLRASALGQALLQRAALWPEEAVVKALLRHGTTALRISAATRGSERARRFLAGLCVLSAAVVEPQRGRPFSLLVRKREQLRSSASPHELLDVPADASVALARRALRKLAQRLHPDTLGPGAPEALRRASSEVLGALIDAESALRSR
jgi:hypothetical protein